MAHTARNAEIAATKPTICYQIDGKHLNPIFHVATNPVYQQLSTAVQQKHAKLEQSLRIAPCGAIVFPIQKKQLWRIVCIEGPQVADVNLWNAHNTKERFYTSKTRQIHAAHLKQFDRLWSGMQYLRPMATITGETIQYGVDADGAGVHDVIGSRCDPYTHYLMTGQESNVCCHSLLTDAVLNFSQNTNGAFRLEEEDVHDVFNVFMCTGFTKDSGQYFTKPSPVQVGDYIELFAEIDLIVAISTCPQGDVSTACGSITDEPKCYPLEVEIYSLTESGQEEILKDWNEPEISGYRGQHGQVTKK